MKIPENLEKRKKEIREFASSLVKADSEIEIIVAFYILIKDKVQDLKIEKERIDLSFKNFFVECKKDKNFRTMRGIAGLIAQLLYPVRRASKKEITLDVPKYLLVFDRSNAAILETERFKEFYLNESFDWKCRPSDPDKILLDRLEESFPRAQFYNLRRIEEIEKFLDDIILKSKELKNPFILEKEKPKSCIVKKIPKVKKTVERDSLPPIPKSLPDSIRICKLSIGV